MIGSSFDLPWKTARHRRSSAGGALCRSDISIIKDDPFFRQFVDIGSPHPITIISLTKVARRIIGNDEQNVG